jgi:hypothetical protein
MSQCTQWRWPSARRRPTPEQIKALAGATIEEAMLEQATAEAKRVYRELGGTALATNGSEMGEKLLQQLAKCAAAVPTAAE